MRRVAELIDRRHALEPVAAIQQAAWHHARRSPRLHDTAMTSGTLLFASSRACASRALARRIEHHGVERDQLLGHQRTAEQVARRRARPASVPMRPSPPAAMRATAAASRSNAATRARSASRSANGPTPQNRSATVFALPVCASTSSASAASPAAVACRNAAGRQRHAWRGPSSPSAAHAARPVRHGGSAAPAGALARRAPAPPCAPRSARRSRARRCRGRLRSRSPGCRAACPGRRAPRRSPRRPASAPSSEGASTGQRSIGRSDRARAPREADFEHVALSPRRA